LREDLLFVVIEPKMTADRNKSSVMDETATGIQVLNDTDAHGCWSCGDMRAAHFCHSCGKVQPPLPTDFFSFFGLSRRLAIDERGLEREMYSLSRHLHPDLNARGDKQEQAWSLEQSSRLNDAYRTLRDPILRTEYLLNIEGIKAPDKAELRRQVPPDLLEEVFELNEQLHELKSNPRADRSVIKQAQAEFDAKLQGSMDQLHRCWEEWDLLIEESEGGEEIGEHERHRVLEKIAALLHRRKYIANLAREIAAALAA
jgi:molecular chaperone HscB